MAKAKPNPDEPQYALFQPTEIPNSFRKAVQVVHSKPREHMSLLQRKVSNAWLKNAMETEADEEGWYTIGTQSMATDINFDSNNREYLKETARELMSIVFEWDVIAAEKKRVDWKASVLYTDIELTSDTIRYQINNQLRKSVLNPEMYALIDMNIIKKFRRGSSLAIYEHCIRFEKLGRTPDVAWEKFRDIILGQSSESKSYKEFKYFSQKVLKPSIAEINTVSDIAIEIHQTRRGKSVTHLRFDVVRAKTSGDESSPPDEATMAAIGEMVKLGVPQSEAKRLAREAPLEEIKAALHYTQNRMRDPRQNKIDKPSSYFRNALKNKWGIVEDIQEKTKSPAKPRPASGVVSTIQQKYEAHYVVEAERYFKELDVPEQEEAMARYNETVTLPALKIKKKNTGKAAEKSFFSWLSKDTWGAPSTEELLQFANTIISSGTV